MQPSEKAVRSRVRLVGIQVATCCHQSQLVLHTNLEYFTFLRYTMKILYQTLLTVMYQKYYLLFSFLQIQPFLKEQRLVFQEPDNAHSSPQSLSLLFEGSPTFQLTKSIADLSVHTHCPNIKNKRICIKYTGLDKQNQLWWRKQKFITWIAS